MEYRGLGGGGGRGGHSALCEGHYQSSMQYVRKNRSSDGSILFVLLVINFMVWLVPWNDWSSLMSYCNGIFGDIYVGYYKV